jgi:hypothetical protein
MIQYARLNKKKNCLAYFSFFLILKYLLNLQSNRICSLASNIAILSHNIAILIARLLWAICNRREQIASWNSQKICKQSLWLDYKKGGSTNPVAHTIWLAFLFLIIQSEALFTNLLWISNLQFVRVGCNLLRAICLSKLQYCGTILQCCSHENVRFDCNFSQNSRTRTTPIAGHLTVVSACSGQHLTNYFFQKSNSPGVARGAWSRLDLTRT